MISPQQNQLCSYRYDPLDRLVSQAKPQESTLQRFYCKSRVTTEVQGTLHHSIVQHDEQLLAQQQRQDGVSDTMLLATDQQRSILHTLKPNHQRQPFTYSPYGYRQLGNGLLSLLGFNGERLNPVIGHYLLGNGYRAFNSVLMRFNSPDSLSPFGKGGINSYTYCLGDPVNRYDPDGHVSQFIKAGLLAWKSRAAAKITARINEAKIVAKTGTINMWESGGARTLKSGVTPLQAVEARDLALRLDFLGSSKPRRNAKFFNDLSSAKRESEYLQKMTGIAADQNDHVKLLNYIKSLSTDRQEAINYTRLNDAAQGRFDREVSLMNRPSVNAAQQYLKEYHAVINPNSNAFSAEAARVRSAHFIRLK
ncbi:RHS repeat-associated core domain-containing protein [Pseudomonas moorei]|jgi:RHS repeat-associated protein|uniref:RHS repeat-associated core domain-containing protein n=1 Tax=Pseudomonas moorei TaxID=395599 RepID=A0A1H1CZ84_9PSED|nr:RHS repeat-associated core domain-containing protein [Pseudomonas moorei]KAB0504595.1 RHS repeat-associated core domain-containing protein [Pseudomonas moorei]SDQ69208.1 RHS repeat-associated core domain-containing protein [Pseudomonas moorei]